MQGLYQLLLRIPKLIVDIFTTQAVSQGFRLRLLTQARQVFSASCQPDTPFARFFCSIILSINHRYYVQLNFRCAAVTA